MPDFTTHIYFAKSVKDRFHKDLDLSAYYLGSVFPDTNREGPKFANRHFLDTEGKITMEVLNRFKDKINLDVDQSYQLGYLTHLYLDYYFDVYRDELYLTKLQDMSQKKEEMGRIRKFNNCTDIDFSKDDLLLESINDMDSYDSAVLQLETFNGLSKTLDKRDIPNQYVEMIKLIHEAFVTWLDGA